MTNTRLVLSFLLAAGLAAAAVAQPQPASAPARISKPPTAVSAPKTATPTPIEWSDTPFHLKSVGLSLRLPTGVMSQITGTGEQSSAQLMADDSTWLVNLQVPVSKNTKATPETVASEVRDQLLAAAGVVDRTITQDGHIKEKGRDNSERLAASQAVVVEDVKALVIPGAKPEESRPAARFYVKLPGADKSPAVVRGYTIFMTAPGHFVTFDLATPKSNFPKARPLYEAIIATARFTDPRALDAARGTAIETGVAFLDALTPKDYDAAIATLNDQWHRRFKAAPTGADADAKEIAYRHVKAWKGHRGELDPSRAPSKWSVEDKEDGYLVLIEARSLDEGKVIDSIGRYFMTLDRKEEAWNLEMAIRDPGAKRPAIWHELGARSGPSMSVQTDGSGESKAKQPTVPPRGYINQVESFLLPALLIRSRTPDQKGDAGQFGFYCYQSQFGQIFLRTDKLGQPQDRAGAWKLETRLNEDRDPQTAIYNERGDLVRINLADDSVWLPTTLNRLMELWSSKGLPTGTPGAR